MLGRRRCIIARDFQSRLAKTVDQVLGEFGIPPLPEFVARNDGEVRSYGQELPDRIARCIPFAELRVRCGKRELRAPKGGHIDFEDSVQRALVVALAVSIEEQGEPVPSGMMRIEPRGPFSQSAASLPVAGVGNLEAHRRQWIHPRRRGRGLDGETVLGDHAIKWLPLDQFHGKKVDAVAFLDRVQSHDIRMVEGGNGA